MRQIIGIFLVVSLLSLGLPASHAKAFTSAAAPLVVGAGPFGPVLAGILIGLGGFLSLFGFGWPDCDDLVKDFFKIPGSDVFGSGGRLFGGKIIQKTECECGGESISSSAASIGAFLGAKKDVFIVGDPKPAGIARTSSSKLFDYKSLQQGNTVLGKTTTKKVCDYPPAYEIEMVGTSR